MFFSSRTYIQHVYVRCKNKRVRTYAGAAKISYSSPLQTAGRSAMLGSRIVRTYMHTYVRRYVCMDLIKLSTSPSCDAPASCVRGGHGIPADALGSHSTVRPRSKINPKADLHYRRNIA